MSVKTDQDKINQLLTRGVEALYPNRESFEKLLKSGKRLRIYVGFDATAPKLHIGHAMQLRKLREFQDLGHEVIMLIGSFTAMIGDPTDKLATRVALTQKQVLDNAATYKDQAAKILDFGRGGAKLMFNHKWLSKMSFTEVIDLASHFTVQQMLERDMFENRMKDGKPIYLHEFMYPLMQGYDAVAMDVDAELGGSDQTFNMLAGRTLMKELGKSDRDMHVIALKLLTNDAGKKMSKTESGFIALDDSAEEMFGKLMAMADSMIVPYFELATDVSMDEINGLKIALERGMNPREAKEKLALTIVEMYHDQKAAEAARDHFDKVFRHHEAPEEMDTYQVADERNIVDVLSESGLTISKSEARRLISQGAIKIDGVVVSSEETTIKGTDDGVVLQRGKRHFIKIKK